MTSATESTLIDTGAQEARLLFREAMARLGAGVTVITTDGPGGRTGFTATAVCSVTDTPPTVLFCINRASSVYAPVQANAVACINVLSSEQSRIGERFGGKLPVEQRFEAGTWRTLETGAPVLEGALMSLDCRVASISDQGTHTVFFCRVESVCLQAGGSALVYFNRCYHAV